jgi:predicted RNase H-like HicB family nuclease
MSRKLLDNLREAIALYLEDEDAKISTERQLFFHFER